jgi:hypothetical protein
LDDLMTSYTHGRHIAIPEKSVFRLISRLLVMWDSRRRSNCGANVMSVI